MTQSIWSSFDCVAKLRAGMFVLLGIAAFYPAGPHAQASAEGERNKDSGGERTTESSESKEQMAAMQEIAGDIKVTVTDNGKPRDVDLVSKALFRSSDPARHVFHGSVWAFGSQGRPVALLSLNLYLTNEGVPSGWLHEFNSLSNSLVEAKASGGRDC